MILKMLVLLLVVCMGCLVAQPLGGQRTSREAGGVDTTNPINVLLAQMDDMQKGSTLVAYQLASPSNRAFTARPSGYNLNLFDQMVNEEPYTPLLQGHGYKRIDQGYLNNNQYFADVRVYSSSDRRYWYKIRFTMSLQHGGVVDEHPSLGPYKMAAGHRPVWRTDRVDVPIICNACGWDP